MKASQVFLLDDIRLCIYASKNSCLFLFPLLSVKKRHDMYIELKFYKFKFLGYVWFLENIKERKKYEGK